MSSCSKPNSLTQPEIERELRQLGLTRGDAAEVHSSLSSFGWVAGGASTVVDALMNVVGDEGTLVMSAYPVSKPLPLTEKEKARGILAKVRIYGEDYDGPTGMGAIAEMKQILLALQPGLIAFFVVEIGVPLLRTAVRHAASGVP